ncbi:MAG: glycosyltransferase family 2 protein [Oscillospiraceae bacterium]|nr:glycosyltransferase family 2 protein [Oscillospiraceae bacterium]
MDDKILLSIITPVHEPDPVSFQRTARSIMAVMQKNWEWIVILHNTHNLSMEDIASITNGSKAVRVFPKNDDAHAPWSPRNFALTKARGKYVYFVDHDDELKKEFLIPALKKMEEEDCDILIGSAEKELTAPHLFEVPILLDFPNTEDGIIVPDDPDSKGKLLYGAAIMLSCKIIRRDLIVDNSITFDRDILLTEDVLFALRCYCKARKICVMPKLVAYTYVQNENSLLQRMLKEDSFPVEVYTEPVRIIVNLALENNISPSGYLWMMMGMFTRIYQKSNMSAEKKRLLMSEIQKYIPLMKPGERRDRKF